MSSVSELFGNSSRTNFPRTLHTDSAGPVWNSIDTPIVCMEYTLYSILHTDSAAPGFQYSSTASATRLRLVLETHALR